MEFLVSLATLRLGGDLVVHQRAHPFDQIRLVARRAGGDGVFARLSRDFNVVGVYFFRTSRDGDPRFG